MSILEEIIAKKVLEVRDRRTKVPVEELEKSKLFCRKTLPMTTSILDDKRTGIIAEFEGKRPASDSRKQLSITRNSP